MLKKLQQVSLFFTGLAVFVLLSSTPNTASAGELTDKSEAQANIKQQTFVRVGFYENPPKLFKSENGTVEGFWPDLVNYIAEQEGWQVIWVSGTWEESLKRMERGEIDVMPDMAWNETRDQVYVFSNEKVLISWSRLYAHKNSGIETIIDLDGKTVAGLAGSVNYDGREGIKELVNNFDIDTEFVDMKNYIEVFEALQAGKVDAGITNKDFGNQNEHNYDNIVRTSFIFQPAYTTFAFPKDGELTPFLVERIDSRLRALKADPNSIYYRLLETYLEEKALETTTIIEVIPPWVLNLIYIGGGLGLFFFVASVLSRLEVRRKTAELRQINIELKRKIKEGKQTEAEIRANSQLLESIGENFPHAYISVIDKDLTIGFTTGQEFKVRNLDAKSYMGKHIDEVYGAYDKEVLNTIIEKYQKTFEGHQQSFELFIDGEHQTYDIVPLPDSDGNINQILVVVQNVTERKQAEQALKSAEQHYRSIFDNATVGIFQSTPEGGFQQVNATMAEIFGYATPNEMVQNITDIARQLYVKKSKRKEFVRNLERDEEIIDFENQNFCKDGSIIWTSTNARVVRDESGKIMYYEGFVRDITERMRTKKELERRVVERTAELNKLNLELQHANRAKDEFLAMMSHELRTPLNTILGLSETLLEEIQGPLNDAQQKSIIFIETSGRHLLDLITDILDLSKIEAGMMDFYPQLVQVEDLCKSSLAFVKLQAAKKSITIDYKNESTLPAFTADPRRIKQILVNLLSNAVKFTPENGKVTLKVWTDENREIIHISVSDTGIGISEEDLKRLFNPFVQLDSNLNRQFEGTGLGLALVKKLTDIHNGSVEVVSEVEKGSRFTLNLPCKQETAESIKENLRRLGQSDSHIPQESATGAKILLAEDNESNVFTIAGYLESHGHQVLIAPDGLQAISMAQEHLPSIILMDIQLPVMDGLEAIRKLRADSRFSSTPIIALTALAMPGDRERCLKAGANEYFSKPVSLKELNKTMEALLAKKNTGTSP